MTTTDQHCSPNPIAWATALAESIAADRPSITAVELADRVNDAMIADGYLMDSTAELQTACEAAAVAALGA